MRDALAQPKHNRFMLSCLSGRVWTKLNLLNATMPTIRRGSRASHKDIDPPMKKMKRNHDSAMNSAAAESHSAQAQLHDDMPKDQALTPGQRKGKGKAKVVEVDSSTFLERVDSPWLVGAHVSAAKGVENSIINAAAIGANAFALFLKSQRKWTSPPLTESSIAEFKKRMEEHRYTSKMVLPHGSYLINLGNPDAEKREKSYVCFVDDLKRCQALGLELYNFHPGSTVGQATTEESLGLIAECINRAHKETQGVTTVLENMAAAGNIIGSDFSHLAGIIDRVEDKTRVGVCIDTCHAFAAGYDIRTKEGWDNTMKVFDETVGLQYLRGMHLNDSKTEYNSRKDRHENIGLGHLGLQAFRHILTDPRTQAIPLILETPSFEQPTEVWGKEIAILQCISGHDTGPPHLQKKNKDVVVSELDYNDLVNQTKSVVKEAEKMHKGPKAKARTANKAKSAGRKRKLDSAIQNEGEEDNEDERSDN